MTEDTSKTFVCLFQCTEHAYLELNRLAKPVASFDMFCTCKM